MIEFRVIDNFDDFLKLDQPWNELLAQTEVDHAYMKHQWFNCWMKYLGHVGRLVIGTAWLDGQLMGIAPMQISASKLKRFPAKVLGFLSSGITPRCNFIVHESYDKKAFFDFLFRIKGWDIIITANIESELKITKAYIEYLENNNTIFEMEPGFMSPYLRTESTWDSYLKALSKSFRNNLNKGINRLKKDNKIFKTHKIVDYENFHRFLDGILETSAKSWKGEIGSDLKSSPELLSFYIEFSQMTSGLGLFELWVLEIDGQISVFDYYLVGNNALTGIRTDFDPKYKYYNPGNILKMFVLQDLFKREGVWEYDLGGHLGDHKTRWTDALRKHSVITAAGPGFYGKLLMMGKMRLLPIIRKWRE